MRQSRVLFLSQDTSPYAVVFVQTSTSGALSDILCFELLLSQNHSRAINSLSHNFKQAWAVARYV